jgi:glycosyltransferase involved in cell wall biosynthesis
MNPEPGSMTPPDPLASGVVFLSKQTEWYGRFSGYYEQLPKYVRNTGCAISVVRPVRNPWNRLLGKTWSMLCGLPARDQTLTAAELRFRFLLGRGHAVGHILNLEDHLPLLHQWKKTPRPLIATIHFPVGHWEGDAKESLRRLSSAIVLSKAGLEFYEQLIGRGRVHFVHHGVDTDFFSPPVSRPEDAPERILFTGQFYRDFSLLRGVVEGLVSRRPQLRFDFVVAPHALRFEDLRMLKQRPEIQWHHGISDVALSNLCRESALLLLPMQASGANNAVVEALASGLPVVTNDVGGIRDYGGGTLFPLAPDRSVEGMIALVERYLDSPVLREETGRAARRFAVETLAWPVVARRHLEIYRALLA